MNTVSMRLGSIPYLRIAIRLEAPQSIKNEPVSLSTRKQVLNRPPLPNASPLPRNCIRMHFHPFGPYKRGARLADRRKFLCEIVGLRFSAPRVAPARLTVPRQR